MSRPINPPCTITMTIPARPKNSPTFSSLNPNVSFFKRTGASATGAAAGGRGARSTGGAMVW